jgi:type II secretory pathway pseudopilin PulG
MKGDRRARIGARHRWLPSLRSQGGFILPMVMMVLLAMLMLSATLLTQVLVNQQHVARERSSVQSLQVAEAGLNQYLWMIASGSSSEFNGFMIAGNGAAADPHKKTFTLTDAFTGEVTGTYAMEVTPPGPNDPRVRVTVTGRSSSPVVAARTVTAHLGRPSFSEYVLLVDDQVYIGGPSTRVWFGKTHSNTGIRIETENITDIISCAQQSYQYGSDTKAGVWSQDLPSGSASRALWKFPVPPIDFNTVTSDFARLSGLATGDANLAYSTTTVHDGRQGWYIQLLPNRQYRVAKVTGEVELKNEDRNVDHNGVTIRARGGYLTKGTLSAARAFPANGVIYVNDNVWVEGTNVAGRITIASSGQLNPTGKQASTSIHIIGNLTYAAKDGTCAIGLIAQQNAEIPMYAPYGDTSTMSTQDMEVDAALISQTGREYVNRDESGSSSGWGPRRDLLTFFGSVSTFDTPSRATTSGSDYCGFNNGANTYDSYLLNSPPPYFPTIGSYQILDWQELPASQALPF